MTMHDPEINLGEGLDVQQQEELGDLQMVVEHLATWQAPKPTVEEQAALMKTLTAHLPQIVTPHLGFKGWARLIVAQVRLFEIEFWYACAAMLLFMLVGGTLVGNGGLSLFTLMGSPLIAITGVLYVYHHESSSLAALEAASPVGRWALFYCRSALILGMNLAALPLLLIPGQILFPQLVFWRVVVIWLGALIGLFGLATYTTVRWNGLMGSILPLGIWGLLIGAIWQRAFVNTQSWTSASSWVLSAISVSNGLLAGALLAIVCGGWLLFQAGSRVRKESGAWA